MKQGKPGGMGRAVAWGDSPSFRHRIWPTARMGAPLRLRHVVGLALILVLGGSGLGVAQVIDPPPLIPVVPPPRTLPSETPPVATPPTESRPTGADLAPSVQPAPPAAPSRPRIEVTPNLTYRTVGPDELTGDLYQPPTPGIRPAVLLIHGGGWSTGDKLEMSVIASTLARRGFVVFNVNYRLSPRVKFPAHLDDCVAALRYLRSQAEVWRVDPDRIGVWGYSAGGHLAVLLALAASERTVPDRATTDLPITGKDTVAAAVGGGTVSDFEFLGSGSRLLRGVFGGSPREKPDLYQAATLTAHVSPDAPPILLYHGTADAMVPIDQAKRLADRLREAEAPVETVTLNGLGHITGFLAPGGIRAGTEFLVRTLKPGEPSSPSEPITPGKAVITP